MTKLLFDENLSFRMYLSAILPKARMYYFHRSHGLRGNASCNALRHKPLERFQSAFPRRSVTTIKLVVHRDVGAGFSPRPDTYRSLKAAPTGLNLTAVTPERENDKIYRIIL